MRAIGSRINLDVYDDCLSAGFNACIEDLINLPQVRQLDEFDQHLNTSRLQHSINVAYYSYLAAKKMKLNYRSAARAGLLHDLFLYNWREYKQPTGNHASAHPRAALANARALVPLTPAEEDAILKHMWPLTLALPRFKESFIVSFADKYCTICEVGKFYYLFAVYSAAVIRGILNGGVFAR